MVSITAIHFLPCLERVLLLFCSHCVPQFGNTALMEASGSGCADSVHVLLSAGAQVDLQNKVRRSTYLCPDDRRPTSSIIHLLYWMQCCVGDYIRIW